MIAALGVVVTLALAWAPASLKAEPPPREDALQSVPYAADRRPVRRLIVKFKDDAPSEESERRTIPTGQARAAALNGAGFHTPGSRKPTRLTFLKSISKQSHVMVSDAPMARSDMAALARTIAQDPRVAYAEIDERVYPLFVPYGIAESSLQWNLQTPASAPGGANLPGAWNQQSQTLSGANITIAILDTGFRPHADIPSAHIVAGYDFISADSDGSFTTANDNDGRDADAQDPGDWDSSECGTAPSTWHGTRVAGIIGAVSNAQGIVGVAYGATLLPVRVLGRCGGYVSDIAAGIQWAAGLAVPGVPINTAHIAKVINLSIGASGACSATFQNAITAAYNAGSVTVVATGNDDLHSISSPANCTGVIAVTAHTRLGDNAEYANTGAGTHISAPGGGIGKMALGGDGDLINSTSNLGVHEPASDAYQGGAGTSFAAPHVSAVAALLLQIRPTLSPAAVLSYLQSTARAFPAGSYCDVHAECGTGMLDAFGAVNALMTAQGTPNRAPVLVAMPTQTVAAGGSLQFTVTATDADGDRVTFRASGLPSDAAFDAGAGTFSWNYALPGTYYVKITPNDGLTDGSTQTVVVSVTGALRSSGGGGGGSMGGVDVAATLLLALAAWALRRYAPPQPAPHQNRNTPTGGAGFMRRGVHRNSSQNQG